MKRGVSVLQKAERKMAEGPDPREKPLEELEKEITCAVCHGFYQKAKLLPCNHYYCSTCIEKMAARSRGGPFYCPECRKETSLPAGGVAGLQPAFFVERIKDLHGKMARAEGKVEALCEQCAGEKSVAFCRQCAEFICGDCVAIHKRIKVLAGHVVASLEDLKKGGVKNIPLKEAPAAACADHGEPMILFCFDCERLICRDCTIIEHKEHKFEFVKKCAPEGRRRLRESLAPLQEVRADMAGAEKRVVSEEAKVERQREEVCGAIQQSFEQLKALLERRKAELVGKVCSLAQEKKNALAAQKTVLQVAQKEIQLLTELVERNVESTSDQDLMSIRRQLQSKMEEEEKHHRQLSLEPTATADIACHLPSPDDIPRDLGSVFIPPALVEKVESCELGSPVQLKLCAPRVSLRDISAGLKCVLDPSSSSLEGEVVENGVGVFSISVTPGVRGQHDLTVKVRGEEIEGSPFRVFVKFPLSQLGREDQTRRVGGFGLPWGIAVNNKQQLIVAESGVLGGGRKITVMERDGRKFQAIECDQFQDPRGVAVASDRAVYVTDVDAKCLFKLNSKGKLLKTVRNELQEPYSVKIIDNRVYVVDCASQLVKIFDMDCNVVGTIQTKECPKPGDIAQGPDGLYVAGERKISVYRCAPNGAFIRHLNLTPSSLKLSEFNGICIDTSGHIIVSDWEYGVYVFRASGECVGHVSRDVIPRPAGVSVDEDGFVYVCSITGQNVVIL